MARGWFASSKSLDNPASRSIVPKRLPDRSRRDLPRGGRKPNGYFLAHSRYFPAPNDWVCTPNRWILAPFSRFRLKSRFQLLKVTLQADKAGSPLPAVCNVEAAPRFRPQTGRTWHAWLVSRSDVMTIARHFNAGVNPQESQVPQGRPDKCHIAHDDPVCGNEFQPSRWDSCQRASIPALKHRAIVGLSRRDDGESRDAR